MELFAEMTQGDPFYQEIAFVDQYGAPKDMTGWDIAVTFRASFAGSPLIDLSLENEGIGYPTTDARNGIIYLSFDADALSGLEINPNPLNGFLIPFRTIIGDFRLTPPVVGINLIQGDGARTVLFLKVKAATT